MARIYVCDRCNNSLDTSKHHIRITRYMDASMTHDEIDFCDDCYELFEDYLADFIDYNHSNEKVRKWCNEG